MEAVRVEAVRVCKREKNEHRPSARRSKRDQGKEEGPGVPQGRRRGTAIDSGGKGEGKAAHRLCTTASMWYAASQGLRGCAARDEQKGGAKRRHVHSGRLPGDHRDEEGRSPSSLRLGSSASRGRAVACERERGARRTQRARPCEQPLPETARGEHAPMPNIIISAQHVQALRRPQSSISAAVGRPNRWRVRTA